MVEALPKWVERRYSILWEEFQDTPFRFIDAARVLREKNQDQVKQVPVYLSELRKAGLVITEMDPQDARQKIYTLKSQVEMVREIFSFETEKLTRSDLEALLKKAADLIRTRVDYKFILIMLFLKRISDKWQMAYEQEYEKAIEDGFSPEEADLEARDIVYHDFDLPEECLWDNIRKDTSTLPEKFSGALKTIADRNPELKDIVDSVDYIQFASSRENAEILRQLIELFTERRLHRVSPDILGDAYEWILMYFAPDKAKEGEVYTPREVIKVIVGILDPQPEDSVYDPACGSARILIESHEHVETNYGESETQKLFLYGQEANPKTLALAKMNMYIHDVRDNNLVLGDTLLYPKFKQGDVLKLFKKVAANPPWNQDGYDESVLKKAEYTKLRYVFGHVPRNSADWAWIQHMIASSTDDGRVGVVIDNGCLFRGGKERIIRSKILERYLVDCVVLLPEKLFYNTGAPGVLIFFRKIKPDDKKDKILFINASEEYEQHPEIRKLNRLGYKHIDKIVNVYKEYREEKGFSRVVPLSEIKENDYNLNVTLYVFPEEEIEEIDLKIEWMELKQIEDELKKAELKINEYLREIGVLS